MLSRFKLKTKIKLLYLSSAVLIMAQSLVGPSKYMKQIIPMKHSKDKNPIWPQANKLAIFVLNSWDNR